MLLAMFFGLAVTRWQLFFGGEVLSLRWDNSKVILRVPAQSRSSQSGSYPEWAQPRRLFPTWTLPGIVLWLVLRGTELGPAPSSQKLGAVVRPVAQLWVSYARLKKQTPGRAAGVGGRGEAQVSKAEAEITAWRTLVH